MKFRKKPVVIEAHQWFENGDHPDDYALVPQRPGDLTPLEAKAADYEGLVVRRFRHPGLPGETKCRHCGQIMDLHGWIDTLEGGHNVCPGDWIITGVKGERYPCKPGIFAMTYEPATAPSTDALDAARNAAIADEYRQWIDFYHAGKGDYADFLRAAMRDGKEKL